jgi:hypothetical protein
MNNVPAAKASSRLWRQVLLAWLWLCAGMVSAGGGHAVGEYQVKAVFLFNFTKFVDWPAEAVAATNLPFVIGIVGEDPFGTTLDEAVREELARNRPIVIQRFRSNETIAKCDILFIARSEKDRLNAVLEQVKSQAILTVADTAQAAEQGVMINLSLAQGSVKMEINQNAAAAAGLKVSAKLLSLARIVNPVADKPPPQP